MIFDRLCVLGAYLDLPVDDGRKEQRIVLSSHVCKVHAPQTKILQRVTKDDMRVFEVLFKAVSTGFGLRKSAFHLLFSLAKSSFGDHDLAKLKYDINFRAEKTRSLTLGIC